ncbi:hypothetical protein PF008_g15821 [Phytophthora fragariae]|uniref:V-ATPase proteolipid subunit C-like domain-containing protein n=1 Tax=Phytophthora fragariae TaxID=53985 RepID=A0A6G0RDJ1_9STRA|nr:hypothetical protein PF008_g15821 [Phytophthora fragariae]
MAIGVVGDAGVRAVGQHEKLFVNMILILIFTEALGLYGLIVALILSQKKSDCHGVSRFRQVVDIACLVAVSGGLATGRQCG